MPVASNCSARMGRSYDKGLEHRDGGLPNRGGDCPDMGRAGCQVRSTLLELSGMQDVGKLGTLHKKRQEG